MQRVDHQTLTTRRNYHDRFVHDSFDHNAPVQIAFQSSPVAQTPMSAKSLLFNWSV